jgi:glutathione S-transferase
MRVTASTDKGRLTIGTISVVCALGYLDFRFADMGWKDKHPKLAKWFATTSKMPSLKSTVPPAA